jgi:DNA-binding IclR family transcriptional regulator
MLELLATDDVGVVGVSALARAAQIPKSTAHRLLKTLAQHEMVDRAGAKYRLGVRFFELSQAARLTLFDELRNVAAPLLEDLFEVVRETVHLAILEGDDVLYLEKITGPNGSRMPSRVGGRMPATCTSLGKAILAFSPADVVGRVLGSPLHRVTPYSIVVPRIMQEQLDEVRRNGVAFDHEEARIGVTCVGAPILGKDGYAVGAVSVAGPTTRFDPRSAARRVRQTAQLIGAQAAKLAS